MNPAVQQPTAQIGVTRVLLCVDPSIASMRAAKYVCQLALAGLHVRIVSVVENPRALIPAYSAGGLNVETLHDELRTSASIRLQHGNTSVRIEGVPDAAILHLVLERILR